MLSLDWCLSVSADDDGKLKLGAASKLIDLILELFDLCLLIAYLVSQPHALLLISLYLLLERLVHLIDLVHQHLVGFFFKPDLLLLALELLSQILELHLIGLAVEVFLLLVVLVHLEHEPVSFRVSKGDLRLRIIILHDDVVVKLDLQLVNDLLLLL